LKGLKKLNTVEGVEEVEGVEDYHVFINSLGFKPQAIEFYGSFNPKPKT
jgi:hypothetical protein